MNAGTPRASFSGVLALLTGLCAAGLSAAWMARFRNGGLRFAMLPPDDPMEYDSLVTNVLFTELYMFGVPILALIALAAGAVGWRQRKGRAGFALGAAAMAGYAIALRSALTIP